ncbi:MAG: uncharacterized protein A8A55_0682 [Amphiamblys sp. WSBS2006]|nr:MAG: uncharacterized protein A8A55_0682 [Amphiamblys sp. WSBS2006]
MLVAGILFWNLEMEQEKSTIRDRLYLRNTGIMFLSLLGRTKYIPGVQIDVGGEGRHLFASMSSSLGRLAALCSKRNVRIRTNVFTETNFADTGDRHGMKQIGGQWSRAECILTKHLYGLYLCLARMVERRSIEAVV